MDKQFPVSRASDHVEMSVKISGACYDLPSSVVASMPARHCLAKVSQCQPIRTFFYIFAAYVRTGVLLNDLTFVFCWYIL